MRTPRYSSSGFTIIEVLVYLSILVVVSTSSVMLLLSLDSIIDQYRIETALYRSGTNAMEHIVTELRRSNQLDGANTVLDDSTIGKLTLINGVTTTSFEKVGTELQLTVNGSNLGGMTDDTVVVNGFTVHQYNTAIGSLIRVRLELTGTVDGVTKDFNLQGGAVIRGAL